MLSFEGDLAEADFCLTNGRGVYWNTLKSYHSGFRGERVSRTLSGITLELVRSVLKTRPRMGFYISAAGHKFL